MKSILGLNSMTASVIWSPQYGRPTSDAEQLRGKSKLTCNASFAAKLPLIASDTEMTPPSPVRFVASGMSNGASPVSVSKNVTVNNLPSSESISPSVCTSTWSISSNDSSFDRSVCISTSKGIGPVVSAP